MIRRSYVAGMLDFDHSRRMSDGMLGQATKYAAWPYCEIELYDRAGGFMA